MTTQDVYIVSAKRTAIGKFMGSISNICSAQLGAYVLKDLLTKIPVTSDEISEVIMGQVLLGGQGQNPARQATLKAGLPVTIPATTVNQVCGSGLKALTLATQAILSQDSQVVLAGGQENMSLSLHGAYLRKGHKFGDINLTDLMLLDGLTDAYSGQAMGMTAENLVKRFDITRNAQDEFAYLSIQKALQAQEKMQQEITEIKIMEGVKNINFTTDESIRADTDLLKLARLKPAFVKGGSVTAGNSSTISDGAAAVLVVSSEALKRYNLTPLVRIVSYAQIGLDPQLMGLGPVEAVKVALAKAGWHIEDIDLIELNEAFAVQAICVIKELQLDIAKVNVNGGAIAMGHPIGASGARIVVTLIHEMLRRKANKGIATLCIGGGMGIAICLERC